LKAWGAKDLALDDAALQPSAEELAASVFYVLKPAKRQNGECWFRTGKTCPFSKEGLLKAGVKTEKIAEISRIYTLCGDPATHGATA
jgi:hypothetical protein